MTATTADPLVGRLDDLEELAATARSRGQISDEAASQAGRFVALAREILPLATGWAAVRAQLLDATDLGIATLHRSSRIPGSDDVPAVDVTGVVTGILASLAAYAASIRKAIADEDTTRLLEIQRVVSKAFGPGFNARALGQGDPARQPDPEPEPGPPPGPSLADILRDLARAIPLEVLVIVLAVAAALAALMIWRP